MTAAFVMTKDFRDGFKRFQREAGGDLRTFMTEAMRVLVETCYHWTAPPTKGNRGSRGGRVGGKAMVESSLYSIVGIRQQEYLDMLERRFGGSHIDSGLISKKSGRQFTNVEINARGDQAQLDAYHKSRRGYSGGRTYGRNTTYDKRGESVSNRMLMTQRTFDKYKKTVDRRVGKLKSGWQPALQAVKSKLPQSWVKTAGGLSGHNGQGRGDFSDRLNVDQWAGELLGSNDVPYFRNDGFMDRAHKYVETWMTSGRKWEGWVDRMIKKHSQSQAKAA